MSVSNKIVIEKQIILKEREVIDLSYSEDESIDGDNTKIPHSINQTNLHVEDGSNGFYSNDVDNEEISNNEKSIVNHGGLRVILTFPQPMSKWKDVAIPMPIQEMFISRIQSKLFKELRSVGFKESTKEIGDKMVDTNSMLMMATSRHSHAINTYIEHGKTQRCPFCKDNHLDFERYVFSISLFDAMKSGITNSKFKSLYNHAKSREHQHCLPHRVMRLYMDEVRNYMEIMVVQTNNNEWTSFHY